MILTITDINKLKIYKVKPWCVYFKYDNVNYMLRHIDECGDHWNILTNKTTWESIGSGYTLFNIYDFIKVKYGNKYFFREGTPYKHIDVEYFVNCLVELKMASLKL